MAEAEPCGFFHRFILWWTLLYS